ncbi:MAG: hypothetical protein HDT44_06940 [Ruminococcaceae bacterium]|nr:hypothetical protein [Oscillospiraceae bacterium]
MKIKKTLFTVLTAMSLLITSSCASENQISFENVTNNRSNGQNFYEGRYSYTDNCIYCAFEDGIYEYDISEKTALKIVDFASISKELTWYDCSFAYIPDGIVIQGRGEEFDYDEKTGIVSQSFNLYVVNFKGELKDTIVLKYQTNENDPSQNEDHAIRGFYKFIIDNGWIYGSDRGSEVVRYDPLTEEVQYLGGGFISIAGDHIYFMDNYIIDDSDSSRTEDTISRVRESDLSNRETISFKGRISLDPKFGDEIMSRFSAYADETLVCRKEIYSKGDEENYYDHWKGEKWYSFKFGEEPKVIGDGLAEYDDVFYAGGDYYAFSVIEAENLGEEVITDIDVIKVDGKSFEKTAVFNGKLKRKGYPIMMGEKFILLNHSEDSAVIYNTETGELINCTK